MILALVVLRVTPVVSVVREDVVSVTPLVVKVLTPVLPKTGGVLTGVLLPTKVVPGTAGGAVGVSVVAVSGVRVVVVVTDKEDGTAGVGVSAPVVAGGGVSVPEVPGTEAEVGGP